MLRKKNKRKKRTEEEEKSRRKERKAKQTNKKQKNLTNLRWASVIHVGMTESCKIAYEALLHIQRETGQRKKRKLMSKMSN